MPADPRVDAYIAKQADFARPILSRLRALVHGASDEIGEAIKWGMPFFTYKGQNLCSMAAFRHHAAFGFWRGMARRENASDEAMGQYGRLTSLAGLPEAEIAALLVEAMALIESGEKAPREQKAPRPPLPLHPAFEAALRADRAAWAAWSGFPSGKVRDYCEWINDAKQDATRDKRIAQAVEWIAQGKGRNWKYERR